MDIHFKYKVELVWESIFEEFLSLTDENFFAFETLKILRNWQLSLWRNGYYMLPGAELGLRVTKMKTICSLFRSHRLGEYVCLQGCEGNTIYWTTEVSTLLWQTLKHIFKSISVLAMRLNWYLWWFQYQHSLYYFTQTIPLSLSFLYIFFSSRCNLHAIYFTHFKHTIQWLLVNL